MNYESLWDCANSLRGAVSSIETFIERNEGEPDAPEKIDIPKYAHTVESAISHEWDQVESYRRIEIALQHARWTLLETSALAGVRVTADHARICRMAALRCRKALAELLKAGEL